MEKKLLTKAKPKKCAKHEKECEHTAQRRDSTEGLGEKLKRIAPREKTPREIIINQASLVEFLKENLKLELVRSNFTDPNNRNIRLWLGEEMLSEVSFDVVQKREYEG